MMVVTILIISVTFGIRFGFRDGGTVTSLTATVRIVGMGIFVVAIRRSCIIILRIRLRIRKRLTAP